MGIMKEKLEAVMDEWSKEEEKQNNEPVSLSTKILEHLLKHPNSSSGNICSIVLRDYPDTPRSSISSTLKQLFDRNFVEREEFFDPTVRRASFKYRVVSEQRRLELEAIRKAEEQASEERLEKMRAQAEVARAAKAAKREERLKVQEYEDTGISAALPTPKRNSTQEILDSLSITQARAVYDELKKIFGG
jgi:predicted transcriptional regulator